MSKVLVDRDWLKRTHRDLDACQKLIWANIRGADPAYCSDAQDRLKEIDEMLAQQDALSAVTAERDGLAAARMAYANEFAPDENGDPDVGNVHANIRALKAERDRLRGTVEDLELALQDAEERAESAGRNASAFEDRMGDLQVENGRLQDRIRPLMAFTQQMARQEGEPYFQRLARAAMAAKEA
ncbi:hypothetical protein [Stutzerimonas kunmingensis]|uniref:hypothetical protein n=1 Tax=Stutzerimonas kunmingensis TaxID=1211807 RepID=UPI00241C9DFB|nr:hypothetical protein [Stutzerimonas kunmingensis]